MRKQRRPTALAARHGIKRSKSMFLPIVIFISLAIALAVYFVFYRTIERLFWIPVIFLSSFAGIILLSALTVIISTLFVDKSKPCRKHSPLFRFYANCIIDVSMSVTRVKLHVTGKEKLPKRTFLLVGNHLSFMDPVVTMWVLRKYRMGFVGASNAIFKYPVVDKILHKCFSLPLDRESLKSGVEMVNEASEILKNGLACEGIYPEGKRNLQPENGLLPFKNGAFKIAKKANCPIVVAVIKNVENIKKNMPFRRTHVYLDFAKVIMPEEFEGKSTVEIGEWVRKILERELDISPRASESEGAA